MYFIHHFLISLHDCSDLDTQCILRSIPRVHCNMFHTFRLLKRNIDQKWPGGTLSEAREEIHLEGNSQTTDRAGRG